MRIKSELAKYKQWRHGTAWGRLEWMNGIYAKMKWERKIVGKNETWRQSLLWDLFSFTGVCTHTHRKEAISFKSLWCFHLLEMAVVAEVTDRQKVHHRHRIFTSPLWRRYFIFPLKISLGMGEMIYILSILFFWNTVFGYKDSTLPKILVCKGLV